MDFLLFLISLLGLQTLSNGQDLNMFVAEHKQALETSIMAGYGGGWKECDLLATYPPKNNLWPNTPQFALDMASLRDLDMKASFSNSHCLLIMAHIKSFRLLEEIIQFGWTAVHHRRLGMALKLGSNLNLGMATNITSLPFPIAAQLEGGQKQYICPSLGEDMPKLHPVGGHHWPCPAYQGKSIRIGLIGIGGPPFIIKGSNGRLDGVSIRLISLLGRKMRLKIKYALPEGTGIDMVRYIALSLKLAQECKCNAGSSQHQR